MATKTISALSLAAMVTLVGATSALAGPSDQGAATGLPYACAQGKAALMNKACGW